MKLQLPPILEYQQRAIFTDERYAVIEGSTKVGKTFPCLIWLLTMAGRVPGDDHNFWWVAPTQGQADIAHTRTRRMLMRADPGQNFWKPYDQKKRIHILGNGHLWFKTGEIPDNLYGEDVYAAVMDEFTRQRAEAWHALRTTLSATSGPCRFIGNVKGRKNWGYQWARKAQSGEPNMSYAKLTCMDAVEAGIMPIEEVEQAKRDLPSQVFRELYLAEPGEDGTNPFGITAIAACIGEVHHNCKPVAWGWDLARSNDWTVGTALCEHGHVCRHERWNQSDLPNTKEKLPAVGSANRAYWAVTLRRIRDLTGHTPALVDSTGPGGPIDMALSADGLINFEGFVFNSKSKQLLMEGLAVAIQNLLVHFPDGVLRSELESFEYEYTRTGVRYTAPEGSYDDCVCSLALAVRRWQGLLAGTGTLPVFTSDDMGTMEDQCKRFGKPKVGTLTHAHAKEPREQDLAIASRRTEDIDFKEDDTGPLKLWTPLRQGRPSGEDPFVMFAAAGDGQGGSPGVVVVADVLRRTIVAQWVKACAPERLARVASMLSLWFGDENRPAPVGYLANTPGKVLGQHLGRLSIGGDAWEPNPQEFAEAIGVLRAAWEGGQLIERDPAVFVVARQYIYANQTMMHASLVGALERRGSHADILMARAGLWRMLAGMGTRELPKREAPIGSPEYRRRERESKEKRAKAITFG